MDADLQLRPQRHDHVRIKARRYRKRMLAVRAMAGETAWLDGRLLWQDGRVVWEGPQGSLAPGAADVALAQRRLKQIARYRIAAQRALGDASTWLQRRTARLDQAKALHTISVPDLPLLARQAQRQDSQAMQRLVALLPAEALCLNRLPTSPSATLLACGESAERPLYALLANSTVPAAARALAALTLGAIRRRSGAKGADAALPPLAHASPWCQRAFAWGLQSGLPKDAPLVVALLADAAGPSLARRCEYVLNSPSPFRLPSILVRELLADGTPAPRVVALAAAALAADSLAERIGRYRSALPERPARARVEVARELQQQRRQAIVNLAEILHSYARASADPAVVEMVVHVAHHILNLGPITSDLIDMLSATLRRGLRLPADLLKPYLELLAAEHDRLWNREKIPKDGQDAAFAHWLEQRYVAEVKPLLALLRTTRDVEIVRRAVELGLQATLADYRWRDLDLYRWLLSLVQALNLAEHRYQTWSLCNMIDRVRTARAARALLEPAIQAILSAPPHAHPYLLEPVLEDLQSTRKNRRQATLHLVPCVRRVVSAVSEAQADWRLCQKLLTAALALTRTVPDADCAWSDWLLSFLLQSDTVADSHGTALPVDLRVRLAAALADGELARFQAIMRTAVSSRANFPIRPLKNSLSLFTRFPALRSPLAQLFPQQPQRCLALLIRAGLATRFGVEALAPLAQLELPVAGAMEGEDLLTADWSGLTDVAPDLLSVARAYVHAQRLRGGPIAPPSGVRGALDQPRKWSGELAYLERALANQPERANLAIRAANLRRRLADSDAVLVTIRQEVVERLVQATAEAQLAVAEELVLACYRLRLDSVAGPLLLAMQMNEDLLNATLLAGDITTNRRLLLRLLRAYVAGDRHWIERHPANVAFVKGLAARGVDPVAWLSAFPRAYRCAWSNGGRVHLHLERDPLRVLQMGNYFDTCLSFGGFNAFSTVANACELNKRVVYAHDGAGRVIGRKLIGINGEGDLVGFHTYTSLSNEQENAALRRLVAHYVATFAGHCGLPLSEAGSVPILFAQDWYDDGVVSWDGSERSARTGTSGRRAGARTTIRRRG